MEWDDSNNKEFIGLIPKSQSPRSFNRPATFNIKQFSHIRALSVCVCVCVFANNPNHPNLHHPAAAANGWTTKKAATLL